MELQNKNPWRLLLLLIALAAAAAFFVPISEAAASGCRTVCGNISVDYPMGIEQGCGHPDYRDFMYCINNVMMMRVASGAYQVLDIDYAFKVITIFDPEMATCHTVGKGSDGFVLEREQTKFLQPTQDTAFMLLGCSGNSALFQGFPNRHLPCRNVSGLSCEEYYDCPSWVGNGPSSKAKKPPPCCAVRFSDVGNLNLTTFGCFSYVGVYAAAPVRARRATEWNYGIQLNYFLPENSGFCRSCKASQGTCGYDVIRGTSLCLCDGWNSTGTCDDSDKPSTGSGVTNSKEASVFFFGLLSAVVWALLQG